MGSGCPRQAQKRIFNKLSCLSNIVNPIFLHLCTLNTNTHAHTRREIERERKASIHVSHLHPLSPGGLLNVPWNLRHTQMCSSSVLPKKTPKKTLSIWSSFSHLLNLSEPCVCAVAWKTSSLWRPLWLCLFSKELRWKAYSLWQRTSCSLCSPQHLWAHSALPHGHRWHEACPYFLAPEILKVRERFPRLLIGAAHVCIHACVSACCQACVCVCFRQGLVESFGLGHLTSHTSETDPSRKREWPPPPNHLQIHDGAGAHSIAARCCTECFGTCMSVKEQENRREWWGQGRVQCVRGLGATALWFLSLVARRISSPVSQCWAHAGQGEPRQENLCWCQQRKQHHPSTHLAIFVKQQSVHSFSFTPLVLYHLSEYFPSR